MSKKIALITGVTGQDGSYLSELLLSKGYEVHGIVRRASSINTKRIDHIFDPESRQYIHYGDLSQGIDTLINDIKPDEIYNTAAQSHVKVSFDVPVYTGDVNALGVTRILEAIRRLKMTDKIKFLQCSSSEMFGTTLPPQNEHSLFQPVSPYGVAKLYGYWITKSYRKAYNMFACNSICFNHESPRRGETFVTRKITKAACRIKLGLQKKLQLGNLDAMRDWGHSKDYVRAMWMIMQHDVPDDYVISTCETHTVKEFVSKVFAYLGMNWEDYVEVIDDLKRPNEVPALLGDSTKIRTRLRWKNEVSFDDLVKEMVDSDMEIERRNLK